MVNLPARPSGVSRFVIFCQKSIKSRQLLADSLPGLARTLHMDGKRVPGRYGGGSVTAEPPPTEELTVTLNPVIGPAGSGYLATLEGSLVTSPVFRPEGDRERGLAWRLAELAFTLGALAETDGRSTLWVWVEPGVLTHRRLQRILRPVPLERLVFCVSTQTPCDDPGEFRAAAGCLRKAGARIAVAVSTGTDPYHPAISEADILIAGEPHPELEAVARAAGLEVAVMAPSGSRRVQPFARRANPLSHRTAA
jgi:hypothetical protein